MLKEFHGGGMAKHVRCYVLVPERRTALRSGPNMTRHQAFYSIPTQKSAATAGEDRCVGLAGTLAEPSFHNFDDFVA